MSDMLHFNVVAIKLAEAIYFARASAFHLDVPHWQALDPVAKQLYVEHAQEILNAHRPPASSAVFDSFAGLTRAHAGRVIGRISESTPWGISK